ncbi:hypothetical protein UF37_03400 [Vibrio parahaemolyticus]|nr:hypothetical protein UF37_03400 [Vibrio parahaemolyticus]
MVGVVVLVRGGWGDWVVGGWGGGRGGGGGGGGWAGGGVDRRGGGCPAGWRLIAPLLSRGGERRRMRPVPPLKPQKAGSMPATTLDAMPSLRRHQTPQLK